MRWSRIIHTTVTFMNAQSSAIIQQWPQLDQMEQVVLDGNRRGIRTSER